MGWHLKDSTDHLILIYMHGLRNPYPSYLGLPPEFSVVVDCMHACLHVLIREERTATTILEHAPGSVAS